MKLKPDLRVVPGVAAKAGDVVLDQDGRPVRIITESVDGLQWAVVRLDAGAPGTEYAWRSKGEFGGEVWREVWDG